MIKILSEPPTWSTGIWWPGNETQKSTIFLQNRWRPEMSGAQWTDEGIRKNKQRAGSLQRQRSYTLLCVLNYRFKVQDFYSLTVEVPCCLVLIQSKQKQFSRVDLCSRVFGGIISSHMFEGFQRLWLSLLFSKKMKLYLQYLLFVVPTLHGFCMKMINTAVIWQSVGDRCFSRWNAGFSRRKNPAERHQWEHGARLHAWAAK